MIINRGTPTSEAHRIADLPTAPVTSTRGTDTARAICPRGPADLPGVIGRAVLATLLPDRRAILDNVVDGYPPVVAGLERDINQIEDSVFSGAFKPLRASGAHAGPSRQRMSGRHRRDPPAGRPGGRGRTATARNR
jgi:hypothetical protein